MENEKNESKSNKTLENLDKLYSQINVLSSLTTQNKDINFFSGNLQSINIVKHESDKNKKDKKGKKITEEMILSNINNKNKKLNEIDYIDLSNQKLLIFNNKYEIDFEKISQINNINVSFNLIKSFEDLIYFKNLKIITLNDNQITNIDFCLSIPNLEELYLQNNKITSIYSLRKNIELKKLNISNNKLTDENETLNSLKNLTILEELEIKENPFLSEIFAYKQLFIFKLPSLLIFDSEKVDDVDRDVARRFFNDKNQSERKEDSNNNNNKFEKISHTQFRVGNTIITKQNFIPHKSHIENENKNNNPIIKKNLPQIVNNSSKEIQELQKHNRNLMELIERQRSEIEQKNVEIENMKLELENSIQLNKEYEDVIEKLKLENENNINSNLKNEEIIKLKKELENWKREYFDLLEKNMTTSLYKKEEKKIINNNNNKNLSKSVALKRPQTAKIKPYKSNFFQKIQELQQGYEIMKRKNSLDESIEDEEENEDDNKKSNINDNEESESSENESEENEKENDNKNNIEPEIDDLLRKSYQKLEIAQSNIKKLNDNVIYNNNNKDDIIDTNSNKNIKEKKLIRDNIDASLKK